MKMSDEEFSVEVTEEDWRVAAERFPASTLSHCFLCLEVAPPDSWEKGWGIMALNDGFVKFCPNCEDAIE